MAEQKIAETLMTADSSGIIAIAAGIAFGLSAIAAAYSQAKIGSAFAAVLAEKPELRGDMLLYVLLPETIILVGMVISVLLILKI
ncbi:MAG: hypothetical protein QXU27_00165 [Candidatus Anstonellales archaeon]